MNHINKKIEIFTDGSCINNPGPGGYGAILRYGNQEKIFSAGYFFTTNNRMELMVIIIALESLTYSCEATIYTDSQYVRKGITTWINNWKNKGWKNNKNKIIKNLDLWKRLNIVNNLHNLSWNWIKGHSGHLENEICDKIARKAANHPNLTDLGYYNNCLNKL